MFAHFSKLLSFTAKLKFIDVVEFWSDIDDNFANVFCGS